MSSPLWTRRELYHGAVSLPDWLEDESGYQFKNPNSDDEIVALERLALSNVSAEAIARGKLESLLKVYSGASVTTPDICKSARWSASCFTLTSPLLPGLAVSLAAIATPGGVTVLQAFEAPGQMRSFETAVATLSETAPISPARPGFHHVPFQTFFLQLPTHLVPPNRFLFRGRGAELRVRFGGYSPELSAPDLPDELHLPEDDPWRLISTPQRVARSSPTSGEIRSQRSLVVSAGPFLQRRYCFCEATISTFEQDRTARLIGTAGEQAHSDLSSNWDAIVDSLTWEPAIHGR